VQLPDDEEIITNKSCSLFWYNTRRVTDGRTDRQTERQTRCHRYYPR